MISQVLQDRHGDNPYHGMGRISRSYTRTVVWLVRGLSLIAYTCLCGMMLVTAVDVVLRKLGCPVQGAFDVVRICGALTVAFGLPYTTAVKGHVAVEFFFQKMTRPARIVTDTVVRVLGMGLFGLLALQCARYGLQLRANGVVTMTLQVPLYPVAWCISLACAVVVLVIFHNLLHPGKETIKP